MAKEKNKPRKPKAKGKKLKASSKTRRLVKKAKSKKWPQRVPKPREVNEAKMDAQLKRLKERKLVPKRATSLIGVTLVRHYHGKKFVVRGTKTGWLVKNTGEKFAGLFGAAGNIAGAPRNPYVFFAKSLKDAEIN